jgi:hypothetical protein
MMNDRAILSLAIILLFHPGDLMQTSTLIPIDSPENTPIAVQLPVLNLKTEGLAELHTFLQYLQFKYQTDLEGAIGFVGDFLSQGETIDAGLLETVEIMLDEDFVEKIQKSREQAKQGQTISWNQVQERLGL